MNEKFSIIGRITLFRHSTNFKEAKKFSRLKDVGEIFPERFDGKKIKITVEELEEGKL